MSRDAINFLTMDHLRLFSPELALVATLVLILAAPLVFGRSSKMAGWITLGGALLTLCLTLGVAGRVREEGVSGLAPQAAAGMLILDNLSVYFKVLLMAFMAGVTVLWFIGSSEKEERGEEFFVLLVGSALGMVLMTGTLNLLMIVIAIELASLPSYVIVGFNKRNRLAAEASLKYVVFGGVCAAIMLYGTSLFYGMYHTLNVGDIAYYVVADLQSHSSVDLATLAPGVDAVMPAARNSLVISVALLCFFVGVAFKIAAVPFHFWCPDAFEGAQIEVTTWLSVSSKAAALILLVRIVDTFAAATGALPFDVQISTLSGMAWAIGIVAAVSCTWGNFAAYKQNNIKRLLAYSSIAHAGYMMMAAAVLVDPSNDISHSPISAMLVYILFYVFMNLGAFGVASMVTRRSDSEDISAFSGLGRRAPLLAIPMVCCLVSLVGLPPFAGFIGKVWILMTLGEAGGTLYWGLVLVAVVNTLVSLFFYLRIVKAMFFSDDGRDAFTPSIPGAVIVNACAVVLVLLGVVFIQQPRDMANHYANNLFRPSILRPKETRQAADHRDAVSPAAALVRRDASAK